MNRLFTLLIFLLITSGPVFAQKPSTIKLNLRTDFTIGPKGRLFAIDTLVDARIDTLNLIGTLQNPTGKTSELQLKGGFHPSLSNVVITSLPNADNKLSSYALIVHEFNINGLPETTRFEYAVTFCKHSNGQSTNNSDLNRNNDQLVPTYKAEIIVENSSATITDVLKQGIAIGFHKFNQYLANPNTVPAIYSDFALEAAKAAQDLSLNRTSYDSARTDEDNLLRCSQLKSGVYQNFNELRQNRPSLSGELVVQEKKGFATLQKSSGSRAKHHFFGFCDGKDLFINTRLYQMSTGSRRYAKVKSIGRYLLWIDNYITSSDINRAAAAGAAFGLIGALAASSANLSNDCIALDMQTGGVFMVTKDKIVEMLAAHDDLLAEFSAMPNQKDEQQQFLLLDKLNQRSRTLATH